MQDALNSVEEEATRGFQLQSYWFAFISACFGIYVMPMMVGFLGDPVLSMIACGFCAVLGCFMAIRLGLAIKKSQEKEDADDDRPDRPAAS